MRERTTGRHAPGIEPERLGADRFIGEAPVFGTVFPNALGNRVAGSGPCRRTVIGAASIVRCPLPSSLCSRCGYHVVPASQNGRGDLSYARLLGPFETDDSSQLIDLGDDGLPCRCRFHFPHGHFTKLAPACRHQIPFVEGMDPAPCIPALHLLVRAITLIGWEATRHRRAHQERLNSGREWPCPGPATASRAGVLNESNTISVTRLHSAWRDTSRSRYVSRFVSAVRPRLVISIRVAIDEFQSPRGDFLLLDALPEKIARTDVRSVGDGDNRLGEGRTSARFDAARGEVSHDVVVLLDGRTRYG